MNLEPPSLVKQLHCLQQTSNEDIGYGDSPYDDMIAMSTSNKEPVQVDILTTKRVRRYMSSVSMFSSIHLPVSDPHA